MKIKIPHNKLRGYKLNILKTLIPLERHRIKSMKEDLKLRKVCLPNPS